MATVVTDKGHIRIVGAERVKITNNDQLSNFLNSKLVGDSLTIATTILNPGGNEQLEISTV